MTVLAPCIECGEPTMGSRCSEHARPDAKGSPRGRGYDARHDALSRRARRAQPFCTECGTPEDLQLHHTPEAWERKAAGKVIRLVDVVVLCGEHNRDAGPARGRGRTPERGRPGPPTQAKFATQTPSQHSDQRKRP